MAHFQWFTMVTRILRRRRARAAGAAGRLRPAACATLARDTRRRGPGTAILTMALSYLLCHKATPRRLLYLL
eukprot:scaffold23809_cov74-Phaeocystis_antarctica.AAC.6